MKNLFKILGILFAVLFLFSCDEGGEALIEIEIKMDKVSILADGVDEVTFTVVSDSEKDLTLESQIFVDNAEIEGNVFKTNNAGTVRCYAQYKSSRSRFKELEVQEEPIFKKNVLVENYTAVWCVYCPRIHDAIHAALVTGLDIIPIAIHGSNDPYYFTSIGTLASYFNVPGYPTAIIDRDYSWPYPETNSGLDDALNDNAALGIAIESTIDVDQLDVSAKVKFGKDFTGSYSLIICLVEDGLIYDQRNFYSDGRGDPIPDYEHNNVLRLYGTDLFGDEIPSGETVEGNEYVKSVSFDLSNYENNNCEIVAFVVKDKKVLNVRSAAANTSVGYEELL